MTMRTPKSADELEHHRHKVSAIFEWARWALSALVIPLAVLLADLRQADAVKTQELVSLRAETAQLRLDLERHSEGEGARVDRVSISLEEARILLARVDTALSSVGRQIDDLVRTLRRRG